jgi:hypothetical protein
MGQKGEPYLLVLGQLRAEHRAIAAAAAQRMDAELRTTVSAKAALEAVQTRAPLVLLIETSAAGAAGLCQGVRSNDRVRGVPIIGMPRELNDRAFSRAFDWGADDLVELGDWEALDRRLHSVRALPSRAVDVGEAVVADHDQARCAVLGRVLANAGYKVRYVLDPRSLEYHARQPTVELIVASPSVGNVWNVLLGSRQANPTPAWVIAVPPDEVEHWANRIGDLERVGVTNALGPPENVVFFSNGLLSKRTTEARGAGRNLYGTTVAFRPVGASRDDYGFTYNVSRQGVYVRSLLSPANDDIWIDVRPPRADRYARLLGRVVWRKALGAALGPGTPPGFAIEIVDGLARDMELWGKGCDAIDVSSRRKPISMRPGVIGLGPLETPNDETPISSRPPHDSERPSPVAVKLPPASGAPSYPDPSNDAEGAGSESSPTVPGESQASGASEAAAGSPLALLRARNAPPLVVTVLLCAVLAALVIVPATIWVVGHLEPAPVVVRGAARKPAGERTARFTANSPATTVSANAPTAASAQRAQDAPSSSVSSPAARQPGGGEEQSVSPPPSAAVAAPPVPQPALPAQQAEIDLDLLPADHGFLRVLSPAKARVLVQGKDVGETNAWRIVKCGRRLVRLGDGRGGFLDAGETVFVQCHGATTVQILPKSAVDSLPESR